MTNNNAIKLRSTDSLLQGLTRRKERTHFGTTTPVKHVKLPFGELKGEGTTIIIIIIITIHNF